MVCLCTNIFTHSLAFVHHFIDVIIVWSVCCCSCYYCCCSCWRNERDMLKHITINNRKTIVCICAFVCIWRRLYCIWCIRFHCFSLERWIYMGPITLWRTSISNPSNLKWFDEIRISFKLFVFESVQDRVSFSILTAVSLFFFLLVCNNLNKYPKYQTIAHSDFAIGVWFSIKILLTITNNGKIWWTNKTILQNLTSMNSYLLLLRLLFLRAHSMKETKTFRNFNRKTPKGPLKPKSFLKRFAIHFEWTIPLNWICIQIRLRFE